MFHGCSRERWMKAYRAEIKETYFKNSANLTKNRNYPCQDSCFIFLDYDKKPCETRLCLAKVKLSGRKRLKRTENPTPFKSLNTMPRGPPMHSNYNDLTATGMKWNKRDYTSGKPHNFPNHGKGQCHLFLSFTQARLWTLKINWKPEHKKISHSTEYKRCKTYARGLFISLLPLISFNPKNSPGVEQSSPILSAVRRSLLVPLKRNDWGTKISNKDNTQRYLSADFLTFQTHTD